MRRRAWRIDKRGGWRGYWPTVQSSLPPPSPVLRSPGFQLQIFPKGEPRGWWEGKSKRHAVSRVNNLRYVCVSLMCMCFFIRLRVCVCFCACTFLLSCVFLHPIMCVFVSAFVCSAFVCVCFFIRLCVCVFVSAFVRFCGLVYVRLFLRVCLHLCEYRCIPINAYAWLHSYVPVRRDLRVYKHMHMLLGSYAPALWCRTCMIYLDLRQGKARGESLTQRALSQPHTVSLCVCVFIAIFLVLQVCSCVLILGNGTVTMAFGLFAKYVCNWLELAL